MALLLAASVAYATPLQDGGPVIDVQGQGLNVAIGGTGLASTGAGSIDIAVGGPVVSATLYWTVRDFPCQLVGPNCAPPTADNALLFDGDLFAGTIVGSEENQPADPTQRTNNIGYAADVTSKVTGSGTYTVADPDPSDNLFTLDGAGLFVVYTDPSDTATYRVLMFDGLDFAYAPAGPLEATRTDPVTFSYDAVTGDRIADLFVFAGDAEASRPDRIDVTDNASIVNQLDASDGEAFDADVFDVVIPSGVSSTTAQMFSAPPDQNPDSLLWVVAALRFPVEGESDMAPGRMTGGGNQVRIDGVRVTRGLTLHCDILLSNNLEINWTGANKWHLDKENLTTECIDDPNVDPVPPAAPFDTFIGEAVGRLNGVDGSIARFTFVDAGEPGSSDSADIKIWAPGADPDVDAPVLEVSGNLDGGNLQAHFDQPHS